MKRAELRHFVERFLELHGGGILGQEGELLRVRMPSQDGDPGAEHALAFGSRAHRAHPQAEFVAVGSAFLDRLVSRVVNAGRYTIVYDPVPKRVLDPPAKPRLPRVAGHRWEAPRRACRPLFLFVFVAEYHTIDVADDLVLLGFDPGCGEALGSADHLLASIRQGRTEPPTGWSPLPARPTAGDLYRSLEHLDRRLQRRARRVKEASALEIARETANIEAYYRQLIAEARHPVGRTQLSTEEETERVRLLQLDWKRRVQEVSGFWEACGDVRLSAVGVVMEPAWVYTLRPEAAQRRRRNLLPPYALATCNGVLLEPRCPLCGSKLRRRAVVWEKDLVCATHQARRPEGAQEA